MHRSRVRFGLTAQEEPLSVTPPTECHRRRSISYIGSISDAALVARTRARASRLDRECDRREGMWTAAAASTRLRRRLHRATPRLARCADHRAVSRPAERHRDKGESAKQPAAE